jgi:hypothetical protein
MMNDRGEPAPYDPHIEDGIVVAAAPLHAVIPWPYRRKRGGNNVSELNACWHSLTGGALDWTRLAMRYWPGRVTDRCRGDRSLAIAHNLDDDLFPGLRDELSRELGNEGMTALQDDENEGDIPDDQEQEREP